MDNLRCLKRADAAAVERVIRATLPVVKIQKSALLKSLAYATMICMIGNRDFDDCGGYF